MYFGILSCKVHTLIRPKVVDIWSAHFFDHQWIGTVLPQLRDFWMRTLEGAEPGLRRAKKNRWVTTNQPLRCQQTVLFAPLNNRIRYVLWKDARIFARCYWFLHSKRQCLRAVPRWPGMCVSVCACAWLDSHVTAHQHQGDEGLSSCAVIGVGTCGIDLMSAVPPLLQRCAAT